MGRQILDQALIANEAIENNQVYKEEVIFKLEFEKAYDHDERDFLDKLLHEKGFGHKWRMWMWGCVRNVNYCILLPRAFDGR